MEDDKFRSILSEIVELLEAGHEKSFAAAVRSEVSGSEKRLDDFLVSNNLWGGSGSLADSAFASDSQHPERNQNRGAFESLMIELGRAQIAAGCVNVRTRAWVEAFENWRQKGLR